MVTTILILAVLGVIAYFIFKPKPKPPVTTTTTTKFEPHPTTTVSPTPEITTVRIYNNADSTITFSEIRVDSDVIWSGTLLPGDSIEPNVNVGTHTFHFDVSNDTGSEGDSNLSVVDSYSNTLCNNSKGSVCTLTLNNVFIGSPQAVFTINSGSCS